MRVAEFFAGIGLVRLGLEAEGARVVWANDIDPMKRTMYVDNFGSDHFILDDVANVRGDDIPDIDLATASFPCTDLSLAGNRAGLEGRESGTLWQFTRILAEMKERRPPLIMLENVPGLITSRGGSDLAGLIARLNDLGYACHVFVADASWFVPQSRQRVFVIGTQHPQNALEAVDFESWQAQALYPRKLRNFFERHPRLNLFFQALPLPTAPTIDRIEKIVERIPEDDERWWDDQRLQRFVETLAPIHLKRFNELRDGDTLAWRTAYRRTRNGKSTWEIREDAIAGCLRASRGGSSKQALVEGGYGKARVRWLTPREYARLQGVDDSYRIDSVSTNQALFGFGDAVCVPVIRWIMLHALRPLMVSEVALNA